MAPHHHAAERSGQRGDQNAVILPRDRAGDSAGGVTAQAIRDEPFAVQQNFARRLRRIPTHRPRHDWLIFRVHVSPSVCAVAWSPGWRAGRPPLRPAEASHRHSQVSRYPDRRSAFRHLTKSFPIRNQTAAPATAPVRGRMADSLRDLPRAIGHRSVRRKIEGRNFVRPGPRHRPLEEFALGNANLPGAIGSGPDAKDKRTAVPCAQRS